MSVVVGNAGRLKYDGEDSWVAEIMGEGEVEGVSRLVGGRFDKGGGDGEIGVWTVGWEVVGIWVFVPWIMS